MKHKLFVFDVDGTLTFGGDKTDERLVPLMQELGKSAKIAFLSGRLPDGMSKIADFYGLPDNSIVAGGDGAVFSVFEQNQIKITSSGKIPPEFAESVLALNYPALLLTPGSVIICGNVGRQMTYLAELTSYNLVKASCYEDALSRANGDLAGIRYLLPKLKGLKLLSELPKSDEVEVEVFDNAEFSSDVIGLAIRPAGMNKGEALKLIAERENVSLEETVAFGDWVTDIPMLKLSGDSVAPADAFESVKSAAKRSSRFKVKDGWVYEELKMFL